MNKDNLKALCLAVLIALLLSSCKRLVTIEDHNRQMDSVRVLYIIAQHEIDELKARKPIHDTIRIKNDKKAQNDFKKVDKFLTADLRRFNDSLERILAVRSNK